tara:strand:- start:103 stop:801 length:699 start_codon:yes stop_codon:yes gene_type:complete
MVYLQLQQFKFKESEMWKYGTKTIRPGKGWVDDNKVRHPSNWHIWSAEEKAKYNIKEVIEDRPPDSRLYTWSMGGDGKITSTAKPLDNIKTTLKNEVKDQQGSFLSETDWAYIRHYDTGIDVPAKIETWRNAIRAKATEMEDAIDKASDIDGIAVLLASFDVDANPLSKFKEAVTKSLGITILSIKEIEKLTPEQKTTYDSDLEKINKEAESKREIEMNKYPFLSVWPKLEE